MNRATSINIASGLAVFGIATCALAAPAAARPYDPESRISNSTRCVGDQPLYDHPEEYLRLCLQDDLVADPPQAGWNPAHVAAGAGGGITITCLIFTGALALRRSRRHNASVPSALNPPGTSDSSYTDVLER